MTILLNDTTSGEIEDSIFVPLLSNAYWRPRDVVERKIKESSIIEARNDGKRYLHIIVTNILNPDLVTMRHEFRTTNGGAGTWLGSIFQRLFSLASAESIVRILGASTRFRFSFRVSELSNFSLAGGVFYTMCKEDDHVYLCLYGNKLTIGGTLSRGVKIPRGR